jgi:hypothetical protein
MRPRAGLGMALKPKGGTIRSLEPLNGPIEERYMSDPQMRW